MAALAIFHPDREAIAELAADPDPIIREVALRVADEISGAHPVFRDSPVEPQRNPAAV